MIKILALIVGLVQSQLNHLDASAFAETAKKLQDSLMSSFDLTGQLGIPALPDKLKEKSRIASEHCDRAQDAINKNNADSAELARLAVHHAASFRLDFNIWLSSVRPFHFFLLENLFIFCNHEISRVAFDSLDPKYVAKFMVDAALTKGGLIMSEGVILSDNESLTKLQEDILQANQSNAFKRFAKFMMRVMLEIKKKGLTHRELIHFGELFYSFNLDERILKRLMTFLGDEYIQLLRINTNGVNFPPHAKIRPRMVFTAEQLLRAITNEFSQGLSGWAIAAIIFGSLILVASIVFVVLRFRKRAL